jgi:glutamyl-tRNA synthetase
MRQSEDRALLEQFIATLPFIENRGEIPVEPHEHDRAKLLAALPGLKERAKTLVELAESAQYLFAKRPLPLDDKAAQILDADARATLAALTPGFEALDDWSAASTEAVVRAHADSSGLKLGKIAQPLRAALTGRSTSPGVFDVLAVLGREESLGRLRDQFPA